MATESATHIFASLYAFSDAAKNEVVDRFLASDAGRNADLHHTPENLFIIRCAKDDPSPFMNFLEYMGGFVASERAKEPDMFEGVKLKRLADTQTETVLELADPAAGNGDDEYSPLGYEDDAVENALIPHEIFTRTWRSASTKDTVLRFPEKLLGVVGDLTNCRVELEADGGAITARAENVDDVEKAIMKLKTIDEWMHLRSTFPLSYDFYYLEGELDIMLQMVTLKELPDRRLQTTLTPSNLPPVKNLGSHLAVVMLKKGVILSNTQNNRPLSYSNTKEPHLWKSHLFGPYGDGKSQPAQRLHDEAPSPDRMASPAELSEHPAVRTVDQWIKQSAAAVLADPFSPSTIPQAPPSPLQKPPGEPETQAPAVRKRHVRIRKPLGLGVSSTNVVDPPAPDQTVPDPAPLNSTTLHLVAVDVSRSDTNLNHIKDDSTQSSATKSLEANGHVTTDSDMLSHEKSSSGPSEDTESQVIQDPSLLDVSNKIMGPEDDQAAPTKVVVRPPPIKAPYMPVQPKPSSNPDDLISGATWSDQVVINIPGASLIDLAPSTRLFQERVQRQSEADTRSLKRTMNQQKPAPLAGSSNSLAMLYKNFELATTDILLLAQKAQGPLSLQMEIGRILINPGPSEFKKKPFQVGEWPLAFPGGRKLDNLFTKVLTTFPNDAEFILDLKLSVNRKMFVESAAKRRVSYNFDCRTRNNDQVIVEIEENGTFKVMCNQSIIGASNWHFPKRSWDARLVVNCFEHVSDEIQEAAQDLVNNLRVIPAEDRKAFEFSVKSSTGGLQVLTGFLRREASHQSSEYPNIMVNLCEVQDLNVWQPHGPKGPYEGSLMFPQSAAINSGKLWWEVTVSCVGVDTILQANEYLEVGSGAKWKPSDILASDAVSQLCNVTRDLVVRIDSVGCHNKGPKGGPGTKTSERDKKTEVVYW